MLHIISGSPFQNSALKDCRKIAQAGDAVVLLADAVYAVLSEESDFSGLQMFALTDHIKARGIRTPEWVTCIDYDQMVALTCQHHPVQTWS